ncbi:MAG: hypothetical protein AAB401_17015 [Acidobacteriota bacterium]
MTMQVCAGSCWAVRGAGESVLPAVLSKDTATFGLPATESPASAKDRFAAKPIQPDWASNAKQAKRLSATVKVMNFDCLVKRVSESRTYPLNKDINQQLLLVY